MFLLGCRRPDMFCRLFLSLPVENTEETIWYKVTKNMKTNAMYDMTFIANDGIKCFVVVTMVNRKTFADGLFNRFSLCLSFID